MGKREMTMKKIKQKKSVYKKTVVKESLQMYALMFPVLLLIFIFSYIPLFGLVISFQDYQAGRPFFGEGVVWVGLDWFKKFIEGHYFGRLMRNTLILSGLNLIFGFTLPIMFALLLDQIRHVLYKKVVQTVSYMPYFISAVVVAGMVIAFIDSDGLITRVIGLLGFPSDGGYYLSAKAFPWVYTVTNVWKSFGFNSILYCSVLSSIDPGLYEAARLDGANRAQQVWHITLPGLKSIIAVQLILTVGAILNANSELILLLYNSATYETADVIGTYVYRYGIEGGQYSYTTAAGLFMAVIGFAITYIANKVSNKLTGWGLW